MHNAAYEAWLREYLRDAQPYIPPDSLAIYGTAYWPVWYRPLMPVVSLPLPIVRVGRYPSGFV